MNAALNSVSTQSSRLRYRHSGQIDFASLVLWLIPAVGVASGLAAVMYWLFNIGQYYIIIVPLLAALAVAGMARLTVGRGHCRNRLVAWVVGGFLGALLYLGSYVAGMIHTFGPEAATDPGLLAFYIRLRLATDVVKDSSERDGDEAPARRSGAELVNWFRFSIELLGVVGIVASSAGRRANRPYCELCRQWMERETSPFEPAQGTRLVAALEEYRLAELGQLAQEAPFATVPNLTVALDYCPQLKSGLSHAGAVLLSAKHIKANAAGVTLDAFEQAKGKVITRGVVLNADEVAALGPRFPAVQVAGGGVAPMVAPPRGNAAQLTGGVLAEIRAVPEAHRGRVLTRQMMWKGTCLSALGLVGIFGGFGLLAWGATRLDAAEKAGLPMELGGALLCFMGGIGVVGALVGMCVDASFGANRMLRRALVREIATRSDAGVMPQEAGAWFIEIVPKLHWGKTMLDNASDIGLLVVDAVRRELRFEGDRERWRIPVAALTDCKTESFEHGQGAGATKIYYVTLRANRAEGFWEAPVRERSGIGILGRKRKRQAEKLYAEIEALLTKAP